MSEVRYFSLARHGLLGAFSAIGIKAGDGVLIPGFICRDVLGCIHSIGAIPFFYQVDQAMKPVFLPQDQSIKAVLLVNYFGFPQALSPFTQYGLDHGVALIEDNAHGWLSRDANNVALGSRVAFGITSFRKTIRVPDGAILHINNAGGDTEIEPQLEFLNEPLSFAFRFRSISAHLERSYGIPLLKFNRRVTRILRRVLTGSELPQVLLSETSVPETKGPSTKSMQQFQSTDQSQEILRRRTLYVDVQSALSKTAVTPIFSELPDYVCPYGFAFVSEPSQIENIKKQLRALDVEVISWPDLPSTTTTSTSSFYPNVWFVNFL